jgi:hypothetical protein
MDGCEFTSGYPDGDLDFNSFIQDQSCDFGLSLLHTNEGNLIENNEIFSQNFESNKRTKVQRSSPSTDKLLNGSDVLSQAASAAGIPHQQHLSNPAEENQETEWDLGEILARTCSNENMDNLDFNPALDFSDLLGEEKEKKIDNFDNEKVDIHQNPTFANAEDESNRPGPSRPQQRPEQTQISNTVEAQPEATYLDNT